MLHQNVGLGLVSTIAMITDHVVIGCLSLLSERRELHVSDALTIVTLEFVLPHDVANGFR